VQIDDELRDATIAVLREEGWQGLTLERTAGRFTARRAA